MPAYSVLAASSDPAILDMAKAALTEEKRSPILCGGGAEALESAQTVKDRPPLRLLVLEACLPKSDGFEVIRALSENPELKTVPCLMLLDPKQSPAARKSSVRLGADDYLQKPFEMNELRAKIHSMTKHFRAHAAPHPVTALPGHPELESQVLARINRGEAFELVCFDINHFRPFNDHYGTEKGDEVIRMTVQLIRPLAHIDGDDFVILAPSGKGDKIRAGLKEKIQSETQKFSSTK